MTRKRKTDQSKLITTVALELACKSGWENLTLKVVAKKAKLKTKDVTDIFSDKWKILKRILELLEKETARNVKSQLGENWRDNLFEILMTRSDLVAPYKKAYASLSAAFRKEPRAIPKFTKIFFKTADNMLILAKFPTGGFYPVYVAAFSVLYLSFIETFIRDDSEDSSKIMAKLDRRLRLFEKLVNRTRCNRAECG